MPRRDGLIDIMADSNWSKFHRFWFPVILYSAIIFYVSSVPNVRTPLDEVQFDKILHILAYMPFGFLLARGIKNTKPSIPKRALLWSVFVVSLLYGLSDEVHQSFVPGRDAGIVDLMADTLGGFLGGHGYLLFLKHPENS